ncbi:MAG: hypothetical protein PHY85_02120, partial [Bacteroidales bacterium]|nr:hypothetical protein [Bacteroidales bacterium]
MIFENSTSCVKKYLTILFVFFLFTSNAQIFIPDMDDAICNGGNTFLVVQNVDILKSIVWQDSIETGWNNILSNVFYEITNGDTLFLNNLNLSFNGRKYRCIYDTNDDNSWMDTSNVIQISIFSEFNQGNIIGNDTICYNGTANNIVFNQAPSGGNLSYDYQWMESDDNLNWANISNYIDSYTPTNLESSKYFRVKVVSNCGEGYTNSVFIKVWDNISKPIIGDNQSICYSSIADTIKVNQNASGGNDMFSYQWQKSSNGISWEDIVGENQLHYLSEPLINSTYYRVMASSEFSCGNIASDSVFVLVYPKIQAGIIGNSQDICFNTSSEIISFLTSPSGGGNMYNYQWQFSIDSLNFVDITDSISNSLTSGDLTQMHFYRLKVISQLGCSSDTTNIVKINVYAPFNQGSIVGNDTICYNGTANNIVFNQAPSGGNLSYDYQWMESDDNINWTNIPNVSPNHTPTNLTSSKYFRVKVVSNCGEGYTNSVFIKVWDNISKPIIGDNQSICYS